MYTGARSLGCFDCAGTPSGLGIAPVIVAEAVNLGEQLFSSLFGGSPKPGNERTIAGWAGMVASSPAAAALPPTPGQGPTYSPANAWLWLRCWAGDHSIDQLYTSVNPADRSTAQVGCIGSDVAPEARTLILQLRAAYPQLQGPAIPGNTVPIGTYAGSPSTPGGTIYSPLPGGGGLNLPVPLTSLFNATIAGVPVVALALVGAVLAFSGGHAHGRRH